MAKTICLHCFKKAKWVRVTQFAGIHYYCKEHAKIERDFKKEDSSTYWVKLKDIRNTTVAQFNGKTPSLYLGIAARLADDLGSNPGATSKNLNLKDLINRCIIYLSVRE